MINQTNPRCSFCHRVLYIFTWDNIRTACCNNQNCSLFKQPQNIQGGEVHGKEKERETGGSEKI
jgi:hypothetical protein